MTVPVSVSVSSRLGSLKKGTCRAQVPDLMRALRAEEYSNLAPGGKGGGLGLELELERGTRYSAADELG